MVRFCVSMIALAFSYVSSALRTIRARIAPKPIPSFFPSVSFISFSLDPVLPGQFAEQQAPHQPFHRRRERTLYSGWSSIGEQRGGANRCVPEWSDLGSHG